MPRNRLPRRPLPGALGAAGLAAALSLYGCESAPDSSRNAVVEPPPPAPTATVIDARPAALVNGLTIRWADIKPIVNDIAGAEAIKEVLLDRRLDEILAERAIVVTADDAATEQRNLLAILADDPNQAIRLLDELRVRQNLGSRRYQALLARNAKLRALVRDRVVVSDDAVAALYDARHGPRRRARILTVGNLRDAQDAARRIRSGHFFGDVAAEVSTDLSAARGGLLAPMSRLDPSYPAPIRTSLFALARPGDVSDPILIESGYAILQLVDEIPADGTPMADVRPELERLVRLSLERVQMDELTRIILTDANVTIFDNALHESWQRDVRKRRNADR